MTTQATWRAVLRHLSGLSDQAAGPGPLLLIDPDDLDAGKVEWTEPTAILHRDALVARALWSELRRLPFDRRPLLFRGTPEELAAAIPMRFGTVVSLAEGGDAATRIEEAFDLLRDGGLFVRPRGEAAGSRRAAAVQAPEGEALGPDLASKVEIVRLRARGERVFGRAFAAGDWERLRIALDASHERPEDGDGRKEGEVQQVLLELWSDTVRRDSRPNRWPWNGRRSPAPTLSLAGEPWPRISVVVPSYNQGHFIEETLLSLVNQDYPDLDLIVIDGGSTDRTAGVVERYRPHLSHFVSERDRGQAHAINKGMAVATGEILTWLNSDDMLAEGALHAMALALRQSGADMVAGICRTHTDHIYDSEHLTACADGPLPLDALLDLDGGWNAGQFFYQPEVFFSRDVWERAGGHVREDLFYSMDYELWLRLAAAGARLHVIGRPIALFRRHAEQKTHATERFKRELVAARDAFVADAGAFASSASHGASTRKLTFCFLNDVGFEYGAGIAHRRLADATVAAGHRVVSLRFLDRASDSGDVVPTSGELVDQIAATECDIVVLGNVHRVSPEPSLFEEVFRRWPTVIVVHDFWWVTGRCAYTHGCRMLEVGCTAACPTPREYPPLAPELIYGSWLQKRALLRDNPNVVLAANSVWTEGFLAGSGAAPAGGIARLRLAVDPTYLVARDKATARMALGLPAEAFIVMLSTSSLNDPRKGALPVIELLAELQVPGLRMVILGHFSPEQRAALPAFCILPGYVENREQLILFYAAADVVVGASQEETFGQVFAEAGAAGTPVVAYGTTGVTDAVADGVSGVLTTGGTAAELVRLILMIKDRPHLAQRLHELGPIHFGNEHSIESCFHSFFQVLRQAGFLERLGVRTNITFAPRENRAGAAPGQAVESRENGHEWRGGYGVSWRENASPDHGIPTPFNWLEGPSAEIMLRSPEDGVRWVVMEYQNILFDEQRIEVSVNETPALRRVLPRTAPSHVGTAYFKADLRAGDNQIRFKFGSQLQPPNDSRKLALLLNNLMTMKAPEAS